MQKKTIWTFILLSTCFRLSVSFIMSTYVVFLMTKGMNLLQVNMVNFAFYSTMIVSEIPTGALADVFGRKKSFVVANILLALSFLTYSKSSTLTGFVIAEIIGAIGKTFCNGAFEAWLTDRLDYFGFQGDLCAIFAKDRLFGGIAGIIGCLVGSFLASKDITWPWIICLVSSLMTAFLGAVLMKEEYFTQRKLTLKERYIVFWQRTKGGVGYAVSNRTIVLIVVLTAIQGFAVQAPNMQWQPFFLLKHMSALSLGVIGSAVSLFVSIGAGCSSNALKRLKDERWGLIFSQVMVGGFLLLSVAAKSLAPVIIYFMVHEFFRGVYEPMKRMYFQDSIENCLERATVGSFESMCRNVAGAVGLLFFGLIAQKSSIYLSWEISGMVLIGGSILAIKIKPK